jgi:hypothetical protein
MAGNAPKVEFLDDAGREEHAQAVEEAESALRDHVRSTAQTEGAAEVPKPPKTS